jgi:Chaperone of endosialidase
VNGDAGKPGGGSWSVASDARLKKDIRPLEQALVRLLQLHGVNYEYKDPKAIHELAGQQTGMIAQEVEKVFPEWVEVAPDGMRRLSIRGFEALTVEALRDLRAEKDEQLNELRSKNDEQIRVRDERIAQMEHRLAVLERELESPRYLATERR